MKLRFIGASDTYFKHGEVYALVNVTYKNCCKGNMCAKCIWLQMDKGVAVPYSCFEAITKNWETVEDNLLEGWNEN